jgi:putative oxidoreductase
MGGAEGAIRMDKGDYVQIKKSQRAANLAVGVSVVGLVLGNPVVGLASLPILGYSAYNWLRTKYQFEQPIKASPMRILSTFAVATSLATGQWLLASLFLSADLGARGWAAGLDDESLAAEDNSSRQQIRRWYAQPVPDSVVHRIRVGLRLLLQGEPKWEWFPHLLARLSMGLFFAISGFNKLTMASHWKGLLGAVIATGLPFPKFFAAFLAWLEFAGGSLLTIGFLSTVWAIALAIAMLIAIFTIEVPTVIPPGLGPLDWLDWFLYLPQVMYVLIFLWLIIKGPGPYSIDAIIARKLGIDKDKEEAGVAIAEQDLPGALSEQLDADDNKVPA